MNNPWKSKSNVNPQREHGNRQIENSVYKALMAADLRGSEYKVVMSIIDHTWGFNKDHNAIAASTIADETGLSIRTVRRALKVLIDRRLLVCAPSKRVTRGSPISAYLFNKHWDTWRAERVTKMSWVTRLTEKGDKVGKKRVTQVSHSKESIKENYKESNTTTATTHPRSNPDVEAVHLKMQFAGQWAVLVDGRPWQWVESVVNAFGKDKALATVDEIQRYYAEKGLRPPTNARRKFWEWCEREAPQKPKQKSGSEILKDMGLDV